MAAAALHEMVAAAKSAARFGAQQAAAAVTELLARA